MRAIGLAIAFFVLELAAPRAFKVMIAAPLAALTFGGFFWGLAALLDPSLASAVGFVGFVAGAYVLSLILMFAFGPSR
jgi:hypothetical protein